jgi:Fe-S-cluster containining protein
MFPLTQGEIDLIAQASGLRPDEFVIADRPPSDFLRLAASIHPVLMMAMPQGRRLRLKVNEQGECSFLGPKGCKLPEEARPIYCRLYPFFFTQDEMLFVLGADYCLAQREVASWRQVMDRLGQDETNLRALFARLKELAAEHQRRAGSDSE